jgi:hypothetical protein
MMKLVTTSHYRKTSNKDVVAYFKAVFNINLLRIANVKIIAPELSFLFTYAILRSVLNKWSAVGFDSKVLRLLVSFAYNIQLIRKWSQCIGRFLRYRPIIVTVGLLVSLLYLPTALLRVFQRSYWVLRRCVWTGKREWNDCGVLL